VLERVEVPEHDRDRVGHDHPAAVAGRVPEHVVDLGRPSQLDAVEGRFQGDGQLQVGGGERRGGGGGQAPVAEQEAQGIGVHRDGLGLELDGLGDQGQLVPVGVGGSKAAGHLTGLEDPVGPAVAAVGGRADRPQVVGAAEGGGAVLGRDPEDLPAALRVDAQYRGGEAVRADHQVADLQAADGPECVGGQDLAVVRL
jgi:hypothetical protein